MEAPPVQYVRTCDGYDIAYGVSGSGPPLVVLSFPFEHVQLAWKYPGLGLWLRALAARFTVVQLDTRGSGLSTRTLGPDFIFEDFQHDLEAIVERLQLDRMLIWGLGGAGSAIAARYALDNPRRVRALIFSAPATSIRAPAFFTDIPAQDWDMFLYGVVPRDRTPEQAREQVDLLKQAFDQENYVHRLRATHPAKINMVGLFGSLATPTLVLHARDLVLFDVAESAHTARLARASLTLIDGSLIYGDVEQGIHAIEVFLASLADSDSIHAGEDQSGLSAREIEILRLLAAGRTNQQIADELVISVNTVRRHVSNVFDKTGVTNRAQAAIYARDHGIV